MLLPPCNVDKAPKLHSPFLESIVCLPKTLQMSEEPEQAPPKSIPSKFFDCRCQMCFQGLPSKGNVSALADANHKSHTKLQYLQMQMTPKRPQRHVLNSLPTKTLRPRVFPRISHKCHPPLFRITSSQLLLSLSIAFFSSSISTSAARIISSVSL
jgi:hypothetical protein